MDHVAIDLGGRESQICVRREGDGQVVEESRLSTAAVPRWLERRPKSRVVMETCAESFGIAEQAQKAGHEVRIVPASLVRGLGVGARRTKNDRRDAQALSAASVRIDLPSVHIPSPEARRLKTLCGARESLVGARTMFINHVRGWMRQSAQMLKKGHARTFTRRVRERVSERPTAIEWLLESIDGLTAKIEEADQELVAECEKSEVCQRLMTVPGVGPVTAVRFVAALDDIGRFRSAHAVESYLGMVPGEWSTGERKQRLGITKAGCRAVRAALVQAAWASRRCAKDHPMVRWSLEVEHRRGKLVAVIALARKLVGILYALWRDGSEYNPLRAAR